MPRTLQCPCGNEFTVGPELAGGQAGCPACHRILSVPCAGPRSPQPKRPDMPRPFPKQDHEPGREVADQDPHGVTAPSLLSKKAGECYRCRRMARGKTYHFVGVFIVSQTTSPGYRNQYTETVTKYRNLARHSVFLCRECAQAMWRSKFIRDSILLGAIGIVLFILMAGIALSGVEAATTICLILLALLVLFLGGALFLLFKARRPNLDRDVMEKLVIGLVRDDPDLARVANRLYTTKGARRMFPS